MSCGLILSDCSSSEIYLCRVFRPPCLFWLDWLLFLNRLNKETRDELCSNGSPYLGSKTFIWLSSPSNSPFTGFDFLTKDPSTIWLSALILSPLDCKYSTKSSSIFLICLGETCCCVFRNESLLDSPWLKGRFSTGIFSFWTERREDSFSSKISGTNSN